jgi:hypothetical protein
MDNSIDSENSSKIQDMKRGKMESLYKAFNDLNWDNQKNLTSEDIQYFLDTNSQQGKFDPVLLEKLLSFLGLDNSNTITVEDFIRYYMQFDSDLQKSKEEFKNKLLTRQNSLNNFEEQCNKYKDEELDSEGLCENAKLTVEINDIELKIDLQELNIVRILIEILYNDEIKQMPFDLNEEGNDNINKIFVFKPKSKTENFIIILKCVNDNNEIYEIGKREFPVNEITSQEEYSAQIDIPDNNDLNQEAAIINAKIVFYWSDYQYFNDKKHETESKIEKIKKTITETNKYCKEINDVYLKNMKIQKEANDNIQWNSQIIKPENDNKKSSYIDIDNNEAGYKLNNGDNNQGFRSNNMFDINTNDTPLTYNINPKSLFFIKIIGLCLLGLGLADGFYRNEFHNQLCGLLIFLSCHNIFSGNAEKIKFLNKFIFYFCLGILLYDIIWMFCYFTVDIDELFTGGSFLAGKFTKLIVAISVVFKGFASVILFKKK